MPPSKFEPSSIIEPSDSIDNSNQLEGMLPETDDPQMHYMTPDDLFKTNEISI